MLASLALAGAGCATWKAPQILDDTPLRARATTDSLGGVEISAAVLGADDSVRMFGADVTANDVQPVWVEVRNGTPGDLWLIQSGTDPDYFSPLEVAWACHRKFQGRTNAQIDAHFDKLAFPNPIPPGSTARGILFTNPQPVVKMLYVDMLGNKSMVPFSLVLDVPGYESARADARAQGAAIVPVNHENLDSLRTALEELPNCTTAAGSPDCTGPLNLIMIGAINDLASAVNRRGYRRNELDADQSQHVFGRPAELIARKRAQAGSAATWIRAWRAPVDYRGTPVFVVQVARPMGGRFANGNTRNLKLHGDVDEARNLFIQDMMYSGGLDAIGFLPSVDAVPRSSPRKLADGSRYFTDGIRAVLLISVRPLTFADVEYLDWEPFVERVEAEASR